MRIIPTITYKWIRITSIINLRHGSIDFCLHSSYQICVQKFPSCCKNAPESFSLLTPRKKQPSLQSSILTTGTSLLLYVPYRLLVISFGSTTWDPDSCRHCSIRYYYFLLTVSVNCKGWFIVLLNSFLVKVCSLICY